MIKQDHRQPMKRIVADKLGHLSKGSFLFLYQRLLFCNLLPEVGARFSSQLFSYAKKILLEISLPKGWSQWGKFSDQLHYSMTNFCHRRGAAQLLYTGERQKRACFVKPASQATLLKRVGQSFVCNSCTNQASNQNAGK